MSVVEEGYDNVYGHRSEWARRDLPGRPKVDSRKRVLELLRRYCRQSVSTTFLSRSLVSRRGNLHPGSGSRRSFSGNSYKRYCSCPFLRSSSKDSKMTPG